MCLRFVVQEHDSTHHHFDFRLEVGGILRSWVLPKGPSMNTAVRRLAIKVADHPIEYINFEGIIPKGQYGAGSVIIWDHGTYKLLEQNNNKLVFYLKGIKLKGSFMLMHMRKNDTRDQWLLVKQQDKYACTDWSLETSLTPEKRSLLKKGSPYCKH